MPESNIQNYNHLKIHSHYSICEGAVKIDDLKDFYKDKNIRSFLIDLFSDYELFFIDLNEIQNPLENNGTNIIFLNDKPRFFKYLSSVFKKFLYVVIFFSLSF